MATLDSTKDMMTQTTHTAKHNLLARVGSTPGLGDGGMALQANADGPGTTIL